MDSLIATITTTLLLLVVAYLLTSARHVWPLDIRKRRQSYTDPLKYPHKDPLLGLDLLWLMRNAVGTNKLLETRNSLFERFGNTLEFNSLGTKVLATREPKNIQTVLSTAFDNFGVEPVRQKSTGGSFMAKGIFTADGPIWQRSRALIRPTFARSQLANFDSLQAHVDRFFDLIPHDNSTIDLQPLFKRLV
ncbi:MAG: hypothetical protein LQ343_005115 [Gyalolechia ehrenbergii]|nr:MAG: hypothetical protein LQ343_005115 [Gyalolechia ehrenbergii]